MVFLYRAHTPLWMPDCGSVTYISSLSFDARKEIISALNRVNPCQELCIPDFFIFVQELRYLSSKFPRPAQLSVKTN